MITARPVESGVNGRLAIVVPVACAVFAAGTAVVALATGDVSAGWLVLVGLGMGVGGWLAGVETLTREGVRWP